MKDLSVNRIGTPTTNPVTTVANDGVLFFLWICWNFFGISPSRLMAYHILGCPIWKTNKTVVMDTMATTSMINSISGRLIFSALKTKESGSPMPSNFL